MVKKIIIHNHMVRDVMIHPRDPPTYYDIVDPTTKELLATVPKSRAIQTKIKMEKELGRKLEIKLKASDEGWFLSRESARTTGQELARNGKSDRAARAWARAKGYTNVTTAWIMEGFLQAKEGTA